MTVATKPKPFWRRLIPSRSRAIDVYGGEARNDLLEEGLTAPTRRHFRSDADMVSLYGAVYAAIRRRSRAIIRPEVVLLRGRDEAETRVTEHPALKALHRINESLTFGQGFGLIEQHKLTHGAAYWIKRRNGLGVPVEFQVWQPDEVRVIPDTERPWVPQAFERRTQGRAERVFPEDVVWFRHMIDPRNPLRGIGPISSIRMNLDTGIEAMRFNQKFFDNALHMGQTFSGEDISEAEAKRIARVLEAGFRGSDNAHRVMVTGGGLKAMEAKVPHRDMEFVVQQQWSVEEVARAFEVLPELLGLGNRTYQNAPEAERAFWSMIADQHMATLAELNEFYIWPDFGEEFRLVSRFDDIPALQADRKLQAEVDEIHLRTGKVAVNELRERDGLEPVDWGDIPLMPNTVVPLGSTLPTAPSEGSSSFRDGGGGGSILPVAFAPSRTLKEDEDRILRSWQRRLRKEMRSIIRHLRSADARSLTPGDVSSYDWRWAARYAQTVEAEIEAVYLTTLASSGFVETELLTAKGAAKTYARAKGSELLSLQGKRSLVRTTRSAVNHLVVTAIAEGQSIQTLAENITTNHAFSPARAQAIARTETAKALTQGSLQSYQSMGTEGKEWLTAGDDQVDAGGGFQPCIDAEAEGPIALGRRFNNGLDGPPAHPNCRCTLLPVRRLPEG